MPPPDPAPQPFVIEEYVRWSDVDFAGIIFYGSYARMFDEYDIFLPRKAVHSEFYWPARLDDRLRIAAYVGKVGTKSLTLHFDVLRPDVAAVGAAGWMVLVCVNRHTLKTKPLPAGLIASLAPHTLSPDAARAFLGVAPSPR